MKITFSLAAVSLFIAYSLHVLKQPLLPMDVASLVAAALAAGCSVFFFYQQQAAKEKISQQIALAVSEQSACQLEKTNLEIASIKDALQREAVHGDEFRKSVLAGVENMKTENTLLDRRITETNTNLSAIKSCLDGVVFSIANLRLLLNVLKLGNGQKDFTGDEWILDQGNVLKAFEPGQITRVLDKEAETETIFTYDADTSYVTSDFYVKGRLKYKTKSSLFGNPLQGYEFDDNGNIRMEYKYDEMGQLLERIAS